jgi:hypothetical protein
VGLTVPPALKQAQLGAYTDEFLRQAQDEERLEFCNTHPKDCIRSIVAVITANTTDENGNPVAPDVAAQQVIRILKDARTTSGDQSSQDQDSANQPVGEPLGVVVSADLELAGLRGRPVLLSWSMWQQGGKKRLLGSWLNRNLAFRLEASTDDDTTSVDLWIPLPKAPGQYFIRATLTADQSTLASADSQPFE